ncbi:MAG: tRNA (adenosine(37)-N6)-dimethylallyltransferase MiaA [Oscillospiraceae bacterium]|nr:tRNA (adenosine(37)-N6)-dimethylallyltransferase MiaA [Oscillospiraceae bacterium]
MLIVITGPTATGKTALGIQLAKQHDGEIVSADSMQIYKYMDIGTAKPTPEEQKSVPHHMIDVVPPWENYSVARYVKEATTIIDDIIKRGKKPIIVGGTGLYIDSLLSGREFAPKGDEKLRIELEERYEKVGGEEMLSELKNIDPITAERLSPNDKKRIVRALETFIVTGKTKEQHDEETRKIPPRYKAQKYALIYDDRAVLYDKIDKRVDNMIKSGLEQEVENLLKMCKPFESELNKGRKPTAMKAIGYKELTETINGNVPLSDAIETIKMESRRYAKRQMTWLRRDKTIVKLSPQLCHSAQVAE